MKQSQTNQQSKASCWTLANKSSEPVIVTTDSILTMREYFNSLIQLHIVTETAHRKDMITQEVKRVKSWLNLYKN